MQIRRFFRRLAVVVLGAAIAAYLCICAYFYFLQERMIFLPRTLPQEYAFSFPWTFDEHRVRTSDGTELDALLFHRNPSKGVVYFLHGNAANLINQSSDAGFYIAQGYDFFAIDYRGYGKSQGRIISEAQFYDDADKAYDWLLQKYSEDRVVILAHSLGTAVAAKVASIHHPRCLVLVAPYFSMADYAHAHYPFLPLLVLKYPFRTDLNLQACSVPVILVHGMLDKLFPFSNSERLNALIPGKSRLILIPGEGHDGALTCRIFHDAMSGILSRDIVDSVPRK
jgi:uncharacterized protein